MHTRGQKSPTSMNENVEYDMGADYDEETDEFAGYSGSQAQYYQDKNQHAVN